MQSEYLAMFDDHEQNWAWFKKNYQQLLKKFNGEYVAIYQRKVVDHDKDLSHLAKRVKANYPSNRVLVEYVTSEKIVLVL